MPSRGQQLGKLLNSSGDIAETSLPPKIETFSQSVSNTGKIEVAALGDDVSTIEQVSDTNSLSASGNAVGDQRVVGNTLYLWNGSGWYRIALINETPTWDSGGQPSVSYILDRDSPQDATIITLAASDPDGLPITYSYITGGSMDSMATISQDSSVFTITPKTVAQVGEGVELTGSITFRASDGVNILPHVSSFTLDFVFIIQNSKYTTLLATAVDTSDNNTIVDSSSNNETITVYGNPSAGTFSPYRHGGYSTYFDGTGDYLGISASNDWGFGNGAWTIEFWVNTTDTQFDPVSAYYGASPFTGWTVSVLNGAVRFYASDGVSNSGYVTVSGSTTINDGQWHHVALTSELSSNAVSCYVDGTLAGSATLSVSPSTTGQALWIGIASEAIYNLEGYLADVRIVKGTAVYTSNFTPPTERLAAITNTTLLTCHLPYIADGSSSAHSITVNGDTSVKPFSPYDNLEYAAAAHGGSIYFDGIDDLLTITADPALDFGTGDFTIEAWVYNTGTDYFSIWQNTPVLTTTDTSRAFFGIQGNYGVNFGRHAGGGSIGTSANAAPKNQWNHVVLVRDSTSVRIYVNGVEEASTTNTALTNYGFGQHTITVGYRITPNYGQGYISDLKTVKGTALYTANFTPPTAPLTATSGTGLLLSGTDASIIDKSQGSNLKLIGNTTGSTTQVKFADTKSMYFDGTGDYITSNASGVVSFGNSFTAEAWIYQPVTAGNGGAGDDVFSVWNNSNGQKAFLLRIDGTSLMLYVSYDGTTNNISGLSGGTINTNTWYHVALTWDGSNYRLFLDGTVVQTQASSTAPHSSTEQLQIGSSKSGASGSQDAFYQGYIQDVRFTSGLARYTANFTPPTAPLKG